MRRRDVLRALGAFPLAACAGPLGARPTPGPQPGLFIDASYEYGPISPFVYGTNTGPWQTVGLDQPRLAREAGVRMVRWPGGNWGDENDVTSQMVREFLELCRQVGAEPLIHVRLFGGTPEGAAALVRLANSELGGGVRYWAVGNEPDLYVKKRGADSYTVANYVRDFRAFRAAMKAADPRVVVMGPEISQYSDAYEPQDEAGTPWMRGFLREVKDIEVVSYHRYPFGQPGATPETLLADPPSWSRTIEGLVRFIRTVGPTRPIAVTEANSDWTGRPGEPAGTDSFLNALWWADVLGRLIRGRAEIVAQFSMGAIQSQGIGMFGPVSYDPSPRPIFEVYRLYARFGTRLVHASSDDDRLPVVAARREDGALTAVVVNHAETPRTVPVDLVGMTPEVPAEAWVMAAGAPVAQAEPVDLSASVTFAPRSATLLVVRGR